MKELSDNAFDDLFRKRMQEYDPLYSEEAWKRMEQKLRRRARIVLFRRITAAAAVLLLVLAVIYFAAQPVRNNYTVKRKGSEQKDRITEPRSGYRAEKPGGTAPEQTARLDKEPGKQLKNKRPFPAERPANSPPREIPPALTLSPGSEALANEYRPSMPLLPATIATQQGKPLAAAEDKTSTDKIKPANKVRFSLALSAGPEVNAVGSFAGNKPTLSIGLLLRANVGPKLSLSTGARYGGKDYKANAFRYGNLPPEYAAALTGIDGSCNVLEIPLRATYTLAEGKKYAVDLSSGLSSYLMLKEHYVFKYTPESRLNDYQLNETNANQHYFSVLDLSANYRIKPAGSRKVEFGIEPYMKIPLSGVGEGKVHLKSGGITLNLYYDLGKKNR